MFEQIGRQQRQQEAAAVATKIIAWAFGVAWFAGAVFVLFFDFVEMVIAPAMLGWMAILGMPAVQSIGKLIGWIADRTVGESAIHPARISMLLAWIFLATLLGWLIVLIQAAV